VLDESRVWFKTGFQLRCGMLQPDVTVTWPNQKIENDWFQGAPMIAVEIASPGNSVER
jgi:Uma2 family endonuclease